ncbi:SOS response-associated peptidase [Chitinophaga lutea]
MCYNYSAEFPLIGRNPLMERTFSLEDHPELLLPVIDGFLYGDAPVLAAVPGKDDYSLRQMEWGFIPSYVKNREQTDQMRQGYTNAQGKFIEMKNMLNAKGEELLLPNKVFRTSALERRCLVPADGFYEHRHFFPMGKKGQRLKTPNKYPHYIHLADKPSFFFAGVYRTWTDVVTGELKDTFAIVTTAANPLMEIIHNSKKRMPVILPDNLAEEWMMGRPDENRITELATYQYDADAMVAHTIGKDYKTSGHPKDPVSYRELEEDGKEPLTLF